MPTNNLILLVFSALVILTRVSAFIEVFKLKAFFRRQPWLPALLILADFAAGYALLRFNLLPAAAVSLNAGLSILQALLSVWLLLSEANAVYAWLSQLVAAQSLSHALLPYIKNGIRFIFLVLSLPLITASFAASFETVDIIAKITQILIIWTIAWLIIQIISALEEVTRRRLQESLAQDFQARRIYTQARVFKRIIIFIVCVLGLAATVMVFDRIRELGTSILASAGILTVILGFAAQKTLGGFYAGIQIALTQPIRINDLITIENELGTVEEITLSYVVLRIWDLRCMIIPINYFLEKPFLNLTRASSELVSPVFFYADYSLPVAAVRAELQELVKASPLWDGKTATLQVVGAESNVMKLRIVVSARDNASVWDLKCEILEKLLAYIAAHYPESLPKVRNIALPV